MRACGVISRNVPAAASYSGLPPPYGFGVTGAAGAVGVAGTFGTVPASLFAASPAGAPLAAAGAAFIGCSFSSSSAI